MHPPSENSTNDGDTSNHDDNAEEDSSDASDYEQSYHEPPITEEELISQLTTKLVVPEILKENLT